LTELEDISSFLSYGGILVLVNSYGVILVLVNSVLSSLSTFFMLSLRILVGVVDVVDRARRHCLWRRKDKEKVNSLAAWEMICKPNKKEGGWALSIS
jgi:hypothetical protein